MGCGVSDCGLQPQLPHFCWVILWDFSKFSETQVSSVSHGGRVRWHFIYIGVWTGINVVYVKICNMYLYVYIHCVKKSNISPSMFSKLVSVILLNSLLICPSNSLGLLPWLCFFKLFSWFYLARCFIPRVLVRITVIKSDRAFPVTPDDRFLAVFLWLLFLCLT